MENKVISTEYVKKNFIHKDKIRKYLKIAVEFNEINPYDLSDTNGKVIKVLKQILEEESEI